MRMKSSEHTVPENEEEQLCYDVIRDLDHVSGRVEGSATTRKYMRNELWSMLAFLGAPTWYITLSPADIKHPIAIYLAQQDEIIQPQLKLDDRHTKILADNPVASAHFFHLMIQSFIKHVVGDNKENQGLFGSPAGYYAPVEQQGRLTLHLLWIQNSLSPQMIRDCI